MLIISTIPDTLEKIKLLRDKYRKYYFEYRLDLAGNLKDIDEAYMDEKTILTYRDDENAELASKIDLLSGLQSKYNCMVDLEIENWDLSLESILNKDKMIISCHLDEWKKEELSERIRLMEETGAHYIKIAVNMHNWSELNTIAELINACSKPVLFAPMGSLGISMRCLNKHIGADGTYLGIDGDLTAIGQMPVSIAEKIMLDAMDSESLISGIIGKEQVIESKGLSYYNDLYYKESIKMSYLPFIVTDIADFKEWLEGSSLKEKIIGFSVTMPYKQAIIKRAATDHKIANLWDGDVYFGNTDLSAMKSILSEIKLGNKSRILVLGSGDSAQTALEALKGSGFQTYLSARNFVNAFKLIKPYNVSYIIPENVKLYHYDIVINTTSLGMNKEILLDTFPVKSFDCAIDLPYSSSKTPFEEFCVKKEIKYYSGHDFWERQSRAQEDFFLQRYYKLNRSKEI